MRDTATDASGNANAPDPISAQQIRRALEEVADAAEDLSAAQTETFADRVRVLLELCHENPAVRMVIAPLRELHVDIAPWFNPNRPMPGTFGYAGQGLTLPPRSRDQAAASRLILERIQRESLDAWKVGLFFVGVHGNFDDRLREFYDRFVKPLVRFIAKELRERYEELEPERGLPLSVEQHIAQQIHVDGDVSYSAFGARDAAVRVGSDASELVQMMAREFEQWRALTRDLATERAQGVTQALDVLARALTQPTRPTELAAAAETVVTGSPKLRQLAEQFTVEVAAGITAQGLAPVVLGSIPAVLHALQLALASLTR